MEKIEERGFKFHPLIRQLKPFGFLDYNKLQLNSFCVLSDSGTLSEEAAILDSQVCLSVLQQSVQKFLIRDSSCWGIKELDVIQSVELSRAMWENSEETVLALDYVDTNVSTKVIKLIQSYTKIINKVIWGKA